MLRNALLGSGYAMLWYILIWPLTTHNLAFEGLGYPPPNRPLKGAFVSHREADIRTTAGRAQSQCANVFFAQSDDKDFAKRGALARCSGGMLWWGAGRMLWRGALAGCSGGVLWRDALAGKPARGQEEASKRPGRGPKWGEPHETPKPLKSKYFHEENSLVLRAL